MGTARRRDERSTSDLTARARIRDVAIESFAEEGFGASFRTIAARAGVSPGLITHHFGSKAALRSECDAEVLRTYQALKTEAIADPTASLFASLAVPGAAAGLTVYMLRVVHAGGEPARRFVDSLVDQARVVMAQGVTSGLVRPSRDEEARLRYLTHHAMGAMLVRFVMSPGLTPDEFVASLHDAQQEGVLPILELYTEGLLTSRRTLDDYLAYLWEPPSSQAEAAASPQTV